MCINCYHRRGRTKKAWACQHSEKLHYSKGLCQNCYLSRYYRTRKEQKKRKEQEAAKLRENMSNTVKQDQVEAKASSVDDVAPESKPRMTILSNSLLGKRRHPETHVN